MIRLREKIAIKIKSKKALHQIDKELTRRLRELQSKKIKKVYANKAKIRVRERQVKSFRNMNPTNAVFYLGASRHGMTLGKKLKFHMSELKITVEELSEITGIGSKRIQDIRNDKVTHPDLKRVIAICIALELVYSDSLKMVSLAGYNLRCEKKDEMLYDYFISHIDDVADAAGDDTYLVALCNQKLIEFDCKPLTNLI